MSKQDRQGVRRASDIEQKYSLGDIEESKKRISGAESSAGRTAQTLSQFMNTTNLAIAELRNRIESFYPVGSIYISANATSPAALFGGVWERIEDRFLLAAGDSYAAGATGGEATHELTIDEMPRHNHQIHQWTWILSSGGNSGKYGIPGSAGNGNANYANEDSEYRTSYETGSGLAHNNMPPYLAVYVWRRVS